MGYMSLQHIVKETKRRVAMTDLPYEEEYRGQLKHLNHKEKGIVMEGFLRLEWNAGSARVLGMLQEANIITASEFILSLESTEFVPQIMNDLLETEFSLLGHLIRYAYEDNAPSQSLKTVLTDSLRSLLADLRENPNAIPCNYLPFVSRHLVPDEVERMRNEHLQLLLLGQEASSPDQAIANQEQWRNEMRSLHGTILGGMIVELVQDEVLFITMLDGWIKKSCPFSLKYALFLTNVIAAQTVERKSEEKLLKKFIKTLFQTVTESGLTSKLMLLLLFAREICSANSSVLGTYSAWYKQTFGEMTYGCKKDQFIRIMEMLTGVISLETSLTVLDVHLAITISAPVKCNDYVLNYKQLCRARVAELKAPDGSIVLEDSQS